MNTARVRNTAAWAALMLKRSRLELARTDLVDAAIDFEEVMALNKAANTLETEKRLDDALETLGITTRRFMRLRKALKKKKES